MNLTEIIAKVKKDTRIDTTLVEDICENHIDEVQDLHICRNVYGYVFSFLKGRSAINTTVSYSTGTCDVTQDSTTITGTDTTWTSDMVGRVIKVAGGDDYYEIDAFVSGTERTLKKAYIGATATAQTYVIYTIYYPLESDFGNMNWVKQLNTPRPVVVEAALPFAKVLPDEFEASGEIRGYILSGQNSSGLAQIRFTPIQTTRKRVYYGYDKFLPTCNGASLESEIPSKWHMLFVYKLNEIVFDAHDMAGKAVKEEKRFANLLITFIKHDKKIQKDTDNIMADEILAKRKPMVQLPDNYPGYY